MSESNETPEQPETPEADDAKSEAPQELGEGGVKALAAERDARKAAEKVASEYAHKLKAIEDRDKTEAQKHQEALETAQAELESLTTAKTRAEVAAEKAIPTSLLTGPASNSVDDIAAFADALIAFRGEQKASPSSSAIGRANTTKPTGSTADQFASQMEAAGF